MSNDFEQHLQQKPHALFPREELSEPLLMLYGLLARAVRDGADTVAVRDSGIVWSRGDAVLGQFPCPAGASPTFREALPMILRRDTVASRHLKAIGEAPGELRYQIQ